VFSGVFKVEAVHGVGDKGPGDKIFDVQTLLEAF
jgi:hypothetical protein